MNSNQIFAVWGNPNSGKTITSIKLATEFAKQKKDVILILCDNTCPTAMTIVSGLNVENRSLGGLLTAPQITQDRILKSCIELPREKHIALLGYINNENAMTYANYTRERAIDFFILLRHIADYVIIDCMSNAVADLLTTVALEVADQTIRLSTADLKGMYFFKSNLPLLSEGYFNIQNHIKLLSNTRYNEPRDIIAGQYQGVYGELPHTDEIVRQYLENRLFESLTDKKSADYRNMIKKLLLELTGEEEKKIKKQKKEKKQKLNNSMDDMDDRVFKHNPNRIFKGLGGK